MALKNIDKLFKSSFTEDDVYNFSRDEEADVMAEKLLNKSDGADPLWYLHPYDEDDGFIKLGDLAPRSWRSSGQSGAAQQAA